MNNLNLNQGFYGNSGIVNVGNTCYMNAAIQTISHTCYLRDYLLTEERNIIPILLNNAKKILTDTKIFYLNESRAVFATGSCINSLNQKINDPDYTPSMLTLDEKTIILNNTMTYQTLRLLKGLWRSNCIVNPTSFRRIFAEVRNKFFYGDDQHDAEEAYSCIIQKMQEELGVKIPNVMFRSHNQSVGDLLEFKGRIQKQIKSSNSDREKEILLNSYIERKKSMPIETLIIEGYRQMKKYYEESYSKITEIFTGFYHSSIKCPDPNCGYSCDKFDAYFQVSFEIPLGSHNPRLIDCMEKFAEEEILDSNNLWKCDKCKELVPAIKQLLLWTTPVILVIQIKRFGFDRRHKDTRAVDYPLTNLDISSMVSSPNRDSKNKCYRYDLYSVINHVGGINGGHYYSYCLDKASGKWYKYDDKTVDEISINLINNHNAYILFYIRRDMIQHI